MPKRKWFDRPEDTKVWVSAYRAYRVPSDSVSQRRPFIADFEQVRAVFLRWDAPYQKLDQNIIEQKDGRLTFKPQPLYVYRTGYGVLLLLITPLPDDYDGNDGDAAKKRVSLIRSVMVALMGRNAGKTYAGWTQSLFINYVSRPFARNELPRVTAIIFSRARVEDNKGCR